MTSKRIVVAIASIIVVLAGLGLAVSGMVAPAWNGECWFLKRQAVHVLVCVIAACAAAFVPWRVWLKSAPWLFVVWMLLFFSSFMFSPINGVHRWVFIGPVRIDTWTLGWPAVILFMCWLRSRFQIRACWLVMTLSVGVMGCVMVQIATNPDGLERIKIWMRIDEKAPDKELKTTWQAVEQDLLYDAYNTSKWIGRNTDVAGRGVPHGHTMGVTAGTAAAFGKIFPLSVLVLFMTVGMLLAWLGCQIKDSVKRLFLLLFGLWFFCPAVNGLTETSKLTPFLGLGLPLVSFGLAATLVAALGLGILWAIVRDSR